MGGERGSCVVHMPCWMAGAPRVLGNGGNGLLAVDMGPAPAAGATGGTSGCRCGHRAGGDGVPPYWSRWHSQKCIFKLLPHTSK